MTVRAASETGMPKVIANASKLGVGDFPNYLSIALGAGDTTVARLVNAYAIIANHGRSVKQSLIDFVQNREGKVIYRTDNRCAFMGNCNAPDWNGKAMPRPPSRTKQVIDAMAAFQMIHILEGVVERGTATVLRDLDRPMFGKTGTTSGPTNVWFVGGTPDIVAGVYLGYDQPKSLGGYAQGGRIAAPIFKQWAKTALLGQPKTPFVAPPGIRWVRIDRASGKRVFGVFPTSADPKPSVIWEAFQPQTEPRRSYRRSDGGGAAGEIDGVRKPPTVRRRTARPASSPPAATPSPQPAPALPTTNAAQ